MSKEFLAFFCFALGTLIGMAATDFDYKRACQNQKQITLFWDDFECKAVQS